MAKIALVLRKEKKKLKRENEMGGRFGYAVKIIILKKKEGGLAEYIPLAKEPEYFV